MCWCYDVTFNSQCIVIFILNTFLIDFFLLYSVNTEAKGSGSGDNDELRKMTEEIKSLKRKISGKPLLYYHVEDKLVLL